MNVKVANFIRNFAIFFGIGFAALISCITLFFTTIMPACNVDDMSISFAPYIVIVVLIIAGIFSIRPLRERLKKIDPKKMAACVFFWGLVASIMWIFIANAFPMWDSFDLSAAADILNHSKLGLTNPEIWESGGYLWGDGGYMERYPYQTPIVMLVLVCMKIAGNNYVILFELLNCIACAVTMYLTVRYTHQLFKDRLATSFSAILMALFAPLIIYATFIYGNLICLPFALGCLILQKKALDSNNKRKRIMLIILSVIFGVVATIIKKPIIIVVLSAAIVYIVWGIQKHKFQYITVAIVSTLVSLYAIVPLNAAIGAVIGKNLNNSMPLTTWIVMGIGGSNEYFADTTGKEELRTNTHNAGYYDGYPWIWLNGKYIPQEIKDINSQYIKKRISHYFENPGLLLSFYANKLTVSWAEPTFESFLASNWEKPGDPDHSLCGREYTSLGRSFYYGKAHTAIVFILDLLQSIIPLGVLAMLISLRKKIEITQMGAFLATLGIFVLYLFWETKTQYIFPAYLFMIPFSAMGWTVIVQKIHKLNLTKKVKKIWKRH